MIAFLIVVGMALWAAGTVAGSVWVLSRVSDIGGLLGFEFAAIGALFVLASGAGWWVAADALGWWDTASAAAVFTGEVR